MIVLLILLTLSVIFNILQSITKSDLTRQYNALDLEVMTLKDKLDIDRKTITNLLERLKVQTDQSINDKEQPKVKIRKSRKES